MRFRLELRDKSFNLKEILDDEFIDLSWSYSRIGGCGEFDFRLPRKRFEERSLTGESNVRIYYRNQLTNSFDLWYQGIITNKIPNISGNSEYIQVSGHGYQQQLSRIYLNNVSYSGQEASVIIKSILDNYVTPYTNITYSVSDLEATTFYFDSIQFNETALSAIQKINSTVGNYEWGVNANRSFYFKARSQSIGFRFVQGNNIINFHDNQDFSEVINQVYVQGAQSGGTYFQSGPYNNIPSQLKYNLRMSVIQNSSVTTTTVADQLAQAILDEKSDVTRKAACEIIGWENLLNKGIYIGAMESTTPIPLFAEISKKTRFGQKKFGTFLFSGIVGRLINRINYSLSNNNTLKISVDLGALRPMISEQISQLEYSLEQQRSAAL